MLDRYVTIVDLAIHMTVADRTHPSYVRCETNQKVSFTAILVTNQIQGQWSSDYPGVIPELKSFRDSEKEVNHSTD